MIRAITYTVLICGLSAGAAVALAVVHDASTDQAPVRAAIAKPAQPETGAVQHRAVVSVPVRPAPKVLEAEPTPMPQAVETPEVSPNKAKTAKLSAPKSEPAAVVSTRSQIGSFVRNDYYAPQAEVEIARSVPVLAPRKPNKPRDIGSTWSTGVFR